LTNQVGSALEDLGIAINSTSHFYRDLQIGEQPGQYRVANHPNGIFVPII